MEDTHQEPEAPLAPVALFDEERKRRAGRVKGRPRRRASQPPAPAPEDHGYAYTMDLADTLNLPDEDGQPTADELLARYQSPSPPSATAASADTKNAPAADPPPAADAILLAISSHHDRAEPPRHTQAPRGSADLQPRAPRAGRRVTPARRAAERRGAAYLRAAISARGHRWSPAIAGASVWRASRARVLAAAGLACLALVALTVVLSSSPSAPQRTQPSVQANTSHAPLIGAGTFALLSKQPHGSLGDPAWELPTASASKTPARDKVKPARHRVKPVRHRVKPARPHTKVARHTHTTATSSSSVSPSVSTPSRSSSAPTSSSTTLQSGSTRVGSNTPSQAQSSQQASSTTSGTDRGAAGSTGSAGCRGAGVMAPTNCGKPSL
jgi:hypothetical protein